MSNLASCHIWRARIAAGIAALLGIACFIVSFVMASIIFSETRTIWNELDNEINEFETITNNIWKDVNDLTPIQRHSRQVENLNGAVLRAWAFAPIVDQRPAGLPNSRDIAKGQADFASFNNLQNDDGCYCGITNRNCPAGPQGPPGPPGDPGLAGVPGVGGKPGFDMINTGSRMTSDTKCQVCPDGPPGAAGPTGPPGPQGMKGADGHPGICAGDGQPGSPGEPGGPGAPGVLGKIGGKGPPGKGVDQIRGVKGAKGPPGPPGIIGDTGFPGLNGQRGQTGPYGAIGEPGPRGPPGETGDQGRQGFHGDPAPDAKYCPCPARRYSQFPANADSIASQNPVPNSGIVNSAPSAPTISNAPATSSQEIPNPIAAFPGSNNPPLPEATSPRLNPSIISNAANPAVTQGYVLADAPPTSDDLQIRYKH